MIFGLVFTVGFALGGLVTALALRQDRGTVIVATVACGLFGAFLGFATVPVGP